MPALNHTSVDNESDFPASIWMMAKAKPTQPVNAVVKRFQELAAERGFGTHPASCNFVMECSQAQVGKVRLVINDAATFPLESRAKAQTLPSQSS